MGVNRRTFLRVGAGGTLAGAGIAALGGAASAWDNIDTSISCPSCEELVKFEVTDESEPATIDVATDWGVINDSSDFSVSGDVYTLQPDNADVDARIKLTLSEYSDDELAKVDFVSDALICEVKVKDGNVKTHNYYTNRDIPVIEGNGLKVDEPGGKLRAISNLRFYYCPSIEVKTETDDINITEDAARFGIYYAPFHLDDQEVYNQGSKPDMRMMDTGSYFFEFSSPYTDEFISDPFSVGDPSNMKAELVVDPANNANNQGYVDETLIPPGETDDFTE